MKLPEILDASWRAVPSTVPLVRRTVVAHLDAAETPDPPLNDIGLAVSEAVSNVVVHAYRGREPGLVRVRVELEPDEVEVIVEDDGAGMVPRADSPGLGLGMPMIARLCDRFDVRSLADGGTRLCMWFKKDPAAATLPG